MSRIHMSNFTDLTKSMKASEWLSQVGGGPVGDVGLRMEIAGFCGDRQIAERLRELGFVTGEQLEYRGRAPFSGPWLLRLGTVVMALRDNEAECLMVVSTP